jgi:two-component system CitB family sensor kinase
MSLRVQLLLLQVVIVLATVAGTGFVASWFLEHQLRESYRERMTAVAQSVATLPSVVDAINGPDPSSIIQPIAEVIRKGSNVTYVVVTDASGIRLSHPDPSRIGEPVSTDPTVPLSGETYVGTQTGTLGESWRVKVPIFDSDRVIGSVSVGILESQLRSDFVNGLGWLFATLGGAAVLGVLGSAWVTAVIRKRIFRLEPEQIAALLESREAMVHGIHEGVVAIDDRNRIALINDAAVELLGIAGSDALIGRPAAEVLDPEIVQLFDEIEPDGRLVLSGERVLVARSAAAEVDGRTVGRTLLLRDHTELHALLRDLEGAQSLADGLRSQSHEFANKLHVVSGLLELGHVAEAVSFINRAGNGGALSQTGASTGIHDVEVAALLLAKQHRARELDVSVTVAPESSLPTLAGTSDVDRLRNDVLSVVGNFVDNAVEACDLGGQVRVLIQYRPRPDGGSEIVIEVADDGRGVPEAERERVFAPGVSTKSPSSPRSMNGRGIGLTLVARITTRYGGSARIQQSVTGGALATAVIPLPDRRGNDVGATP